MMLFLMAAVPALCGVGCLFHSWKSARGHGRTLVIYGWMLLALSLLGWIQLAGAEYGVVFALLFPAFFAWIMIIANPAAQRKKTIKAQPFAWLAWAPPVTVLREVGKWLLVLMLLGGASLLVTMALVGQLPFSDSLNLMSALLIFPTLWSLWVCWFLATAHPLRLLLMTVMAAAVSAFCLFG